MFKINSILHGIAPLIVLIVLIAAGCTSQSSKQLSGVWRSNDASVDSNLVLELMPDGTGQVFSGSSIGLPTDGSFKWSVKGNQITIETVADEPIIQIMEILSQQENRLSVEVNRSKFSMIRVDDVISDDALELPSAGS